MKDTLDHVVGSMDQKIDTATSHTSTTIGGLRAELQSSLGEFQRNGTSQLERLESELRTFITALSDQMRHISVGAPQPPPQQ